MPSDATDASDATVKGHCQICQNLSKGPPPVHCFEGSDGVARYCLLSNGVGSAHDGFPEARRPLAHHASRITKVQGFDKGFDKEWMCWEVARIFQHYLNPLEPTGRGPSD